MITNNGFTRTNAFRYCVFAMGFVIAISGLVSIVHVAMTSRSTYSRDLIMASIGMVTGFVTLVPLGIIVVARKLSPSETDESRWCVRLRITLCAMTVAAFSLPYILILLLPDVDS